MGKKYAFLCLMKCPVFEKINKCRFNLDVMLPPYFLWRSVERLHFTVKYSRCVTVKGFALSWYTLCGKHLSPEMMLQTPDFNSLVVGCRKWRISRRKNSSGQRNYLKVTKMFACIMLSYANQWIITPLLTVNEVLIYFLCDQSRALHSSITSLATQNKRR